MADVSLNLLQVFYLVAKHGSFSAASRILNISYQSAANHIRRLEQIFAEPLVVSGRGTRSIMLTPRGRSLYRLLAPEFDIMLERLSEVVERQRPVLRIGLPAAVLLHLFPYATPTFRSRYPDVHLQMLERDTVLADLLTDGSLDVAISERFFGDPAIVQRMIATYHPCLVYPENWTAPANVDGIPAWAADKPFVTYEPGQTLRNVSLDYLSLEGRVPEVIMSASSTACVKHLVVEGIGYSIVPEWAVDSTDLGVRTIRLTNLAEIKLYFCQPQFLSDNAYVKALFDACATMLSQRMEDI